MVLTIFTYYNLQYSILVVHPVYILFNVHLVGMARLRPELSPLLTDEIVDKLKSFGVKTGIWLRLILIDQVSISLFPRTVVDFVSEPAPQLSKRVGLPCEDVQSVRQSLLFQFGGHPVSARELWEEEWITRGVVITTGCPCLDEVLGGGLICGQLTELCGPPASGKTQVTKNKFMQYFSCLFHY